jgi:hypothetical protein
MGVAHVGLTFSPVPERVCGERGLVELVWGRATIWRVLGIGVKLQSPGISPNNEEGNLSAAVACRNRDTGPIGLIV